MRHAHFFERLKAQKKRTVVFPMHEGWSDVGNPTELKSIQQKTLLESQGIMMSKTIGIGPQRALI